MSLKIQIVDWWPELYPREREIFPVFKYLRDKYDAQFVEENPDLILCSFFGTGPGCRNMKLRQILDDNPNVPSLMVSSENFYLQKEIGRQIDTSGVDYIITTNFPDEHAGCVLDSVEQFYIPYGALHYDVQEIWSKRRQKFIGADIADIPERKRFCSFVVGNSALGEGTRYRSYMFNWLNSYKRVDSAGSYRNNMFEFQAPREVDSYLYWLEKYKFMLCFENSCAKGYITEKIIQAYLAGCIPIYWGHKDTVQSIFNMDTMVYVDSYQQALDRIKEIDSNPALYHKIVTTNPFLVDINEPNNPFNRTYLYSFLDYVVDNLKQKK